MRWLFAFRECFSLLLLHVLSGDDGGGRGGVGPDRAGPGI